MKASTSKQNYRDKSYVRWVTEFCEARGLRFESNSLRGLSVGVAGRTKLASKVATQSLQRSLGVLHKGWPRAEAPGAVKGYGSNDALHAVYVSPVCFHTCDVNEFSLAAPCPDLWEPGLEENTLCLLTYLGPASGFQQVRNSSLEGS